LSAEVFYLPLLELLGKLDFLLHCLHELTVDLEDVDAGARQLHLHRVPRGESGVPQSSRFVQRALPGRAQVGPSQVALLHRSGELSLTNACKIMRI